MNSVSGVFQGSGVVPLPWQTIGAVCKPVSMTVDIDDPLRKARLMLRKHHLKQLPVMRGSRCVGLITERDIWLLLGPDFDYPPERELIVEDAYMSNPLVFDCSDSLEQALFQMAERRLGCALVTEYGDLVGIFTDADACRWFGRFLHDGLPLPATGRD